MNSYDIRCKLIEEELRSVWPEWHVARRLGGGSFGDVFQIYRDNYGIRVESALKVIQADDGMVTTALPSNSQDESRSDIPEALRSEIQIMEALRGAPNIVIIEDFSFKRFAQNGTLFVRMELLKSLQEVLPGRDGQGTLSSIGEIIKLGKDICRALMYCEKRGIIHRDIKPANLFVDRFGDYKVGDFGVSKRMETVHMAQTMTGIGTISYMAPEIFRGKSYNNTVDIYALGLVLYQLLNNGRMPFLPESGSYTAQDIDNANYQRLQGIPVPNLSGKYVGGEQINGRLDAVVRRACSAKPEDRYRTAKDFFDVLVRAEIPEKEIEPEYGRSVQSSEKQTETERVCRQENMKPEAGPSAAVRQNAVKPEAGPSGALRQNAVKPEAGPSAAVRQNAVKPDRYSHSQFDENSYSDGSGKVVFIAFFIISMVSLLFFTLYRVSVSKIAAATSSTTEGSNETAISDSWEKIIAAGEDGTYIDKYRVGDTKELNLGKYGTIEMELVAFNADELADGSGKAHMTWIAKNSLDQARIMDGTGTCKGGWPATQMRDWLQEIILPQFPDTVRTNIKEVKKYSYSYFDEGTVSSSDKIWIPSRREVFGSYNSNEDAGPAYLAAFRDEASKLKPYFSSMSTWWLRSASDEQGYFFYGVDENGKLLEADPSKVYGVVVGFCF